MSVNSAGASTSEHNGESIENRVKPVRLAIVGTPRTGNTWLRHLLAGVYGMPEYSKHRPSEFEWERLPEQFVLQVHWRPVDGFLHRLHDHGVRPIVMIRHPLDVLISILHFSLHDPTERWLEGEGGSENGIYGAMPRSAAFLEYARSPRAAALLGLSVEWGQLPGVIPVVYEVLNRDPAGELVRVVGECGGCPCLSVEETVAQHTIPLLRSRTQNEHHFWQGRAGLWKQLLTQAELEILRPFWQPLYADFDYDWDADPFLTAAEADANWIKLVWADLTEDLQDLRFTKMSLSAHRKELERHCSLLRDRELDCGRLESALDKTTVQLNETREALAKSRAELDRFRDLGPLALKMAFRVRAFSRNHPKLAGAFKWLVPARAFATRPASDA